MFIYKKNDSEEGPSALLLLLLLHDFLCGQLIFQGHKKNNTRWFLLLVATDAAVSLQRRLQKAEDQYVY